MIWLSAVFALVWIVLMAALLRIRREQQMLERRMMSRPAPR
ncbi:MAG: hypothetical protein ACRDF6_02950 [bacterium]